MYCSQCKHSQYVRVRGKNLLHCTRFTEPLDPDINNPTPEDLYETEELLPPCWTFANYCPFFVAERRELKTRNAYKWIMRNCDIPLSDEKQGLLAHVKLK